MLQIMKWGGASVLCATLLACGGGGGDGDGGSGTAGPSAATADINSAGYSGTADSAAGTTMSGLSSLSLFAGTGSVSGAAAGRATSFDAAVQRQAMGKLLARSQAQASGRARALAVTTETEACDSGTLLFTINEVDPQLYTPGDSVVVTSQNCVVANEPVSGSLTLTLNAYSELPTEDRGSFALTFSNFGVPALSLNGSVAAQFVYAMTSATVKLVYQGVTVTGPGSAPVQWFHTMDYSADFNGSGDTVSFSGFVGVANGYVRLDQLSPFVLVDNQPISGSLQLTGANGARLKIIAGTTRFSYEFYAVGNSGTTSDAAAQGLVY